MSVSTRVLLLTLPLSLFATSAEAAGNLVCESPHLIGEPTTFENAGGTPEDPPNCAGWNCALPVLEAGPLYNLASCDPRTGPCNLEVEVQLRFPGNTNNAINLHSRVFWFTDSKPAPNQTGGCWPGPPPFVGNNCDPSAICGVSGQELVEERGNYFLEVGAVSCAELTDGQPSGNTLLQAYQLAAISCNFFSSPHCVERLNVPVDLTEDALAAELGCLEFEPPPCEDSCLCDVTGGGGAGPDGGGAGPPVPGSGPGVLLRYQAGGVGHPGFPGSTEWRQTLGRYWSHEGATHLVEANPGDPAVVWLLDESGTFTRFDNTTTSALPDPYEVADPVNEYRTLFETATGWELHDLDGTVLTFDTQGRWTQTQDRNGNTMAATYNAGGQLAEITKPDGRREVFAYYGMGDPAEGKLESITLFGVLDAAQKSWAYTWAGEDLVRIDRPDGRALVFSYTDATNPQHPAGYMTRMTLEGDQGGTRILSAWEYDANGDGNVVSTWRGTADKDDPQVVDRYDLTYDQPIKPTETQVTDPLGQQTTFTLEYENRRFRVTAISSPCPTCGYGPQTDFEYSDAANPLLPTATLDGRGIRTEMAYDANGRLTQRTEAQGLAVERVTSWSYDPNFPAFPTVIQQPSVEAGQFRTLTNAYDATTGDLLSRTQDGFEAGVALTGQVTTFTYEPSGQSTKIHPPGFGTADQVLFHYADPNLNGQLPTRRTDPLIGDTHFLYDPFNRRIATVDPNGLRTESDFDELDRVTETRQCKVATPVSTCANPLGQVLTTSHAYNEFGDLAITTLPRGNAISYSYDPAGRLIAIERKADPLPETHGERTFFTLDAAGNRIQEEQQLWNGTGWTTLSQTALNYQNRCQVQTITTGLPGEESVTEFAYDCNGNLEKIWDPNHLSAGQVNPPSTVYTFDALERLSTVTQPFGGAGGGNAVTSYQYDVQDHLVQVTDAEGTVTSYEYSDRDLLTREDSEVSGVTQHQYNAHGELETTTDARGITTTRTLDVLDRVTQVTYSGAPTLTVGFTYDDPLVPNSLGRLTEITRGSFPVAYEYDEFGRTTRDGDLTFQYDANGNRTQIGYPGGAMAGYTHDFADREASLDFQVGAGPVQPVVTASGYLPAGPLDSLTLGNGAVEIRAFDSRYYPDRITVQGALDRQWDYSTDFVGNITQIAETLDCVPEDVTLPDQTVNTTETFQACGTLTAAAFEVANPGDVTFEAKGRIALQNGFKVGNGARFTAVPNSTLGFPQQTTRTYSYQDFQYFLTQGDGPWGTRSWTYDKIGNRLTETADGQTDTYTYLPNLAAGNSPILDQVQLGIGGIRDYSFGAAGHQEEVAAGANVIDFNSDAEGRLSGLDRLGNTATFLYDGRSFLARAEEGSTGNFVEPTYSSDGLLYSLHRSEDGGATNLREHVVYFAGRPVAIVSVPLAGSETYTFLSTDHLGTPFVAADSGGEEIWAGGFEPFGRDWREGLPDGAQENGVFLRFPGQWFDAVWWEASLGAEGYYNLLRWYGPGAGRYGRVDPISQPINNPDSFAVSGHQYAYVANQPLRLVDPFGLSPEEALCRAQWTLTGAVFGGVAGGIAGCVLLGAGGTLVLPGVGTIGGCAGGALIGGLGGILAGTLGGLISAEIACGCPREMSRRKARWTCEASCHVNNFSDVPGAPLFVTATASGSTQTTACQAAMALARQKSPRGTYTRHCQCPRCWRN